MAPLSPARTLVILKGRTFPSRIVTVLKDAQIVGTVTTDANGMFDFSVSDITPGVYTFGIWSEDKFGVRSLTLSFTVNVAAGATTILSGIFLPPTLGIDKVAVRRGEAVTFFGQTTPLNMVHVFVNSPEEIVKVTSADTNGFYTLLLDTKVLDVGSHTGRARAFAGGSDQSPFSNVVSFTVGDRTIPVPVPTPTKCPEKADLKVDCKVNLVDFSIAAYWWKRPLTAAAKKAVDAKLFPDGKINLRDFSILAYYWTG